MRPSHQEPGREAEPGGLLAFTAAPWPSTARPWRTRPERAVVDHGVPEPGLPGQARGISAVLLAVLVELLRSLPSSSARADQAVHSPRLKSDSNVVATCLRRSRAASTRTTSEQASLYESCAACWARSMPPRVRCCRGLVLDAHQAQADLQPPSQVLKDRDCNVDAPRCRRPHCSGKCVRLDRDARRGARLRASRPWSSRSSARWASCRPSHAPPRARPRGPLLPRRHAAGRQHVAIEQFARSPTAQWPILLAAQPEARAAWASTTRGGDVHVFHFPGPLVEPRGVENQATGSRLRIGQVHARCRCTSSSYGARSRSRIDEMIEQKTELAQNIIGAGEALAHRSSPPISSAKCSRCAPTRSATSRKEDAKWPWTLRSNGFLRVRFAYSFFLKD